MSRPSSLEWGLPAEAARRCAPSLPGIRIPIHPQQHGPGLLRQPFLRPDFRSGERPPGNILHLWVHRQLLQGVSHRLPQRVIACLVVVAADASDYLVDSVHFDRPFLVLLGRIFYCYLYFTSNRFVINQFRLSQAISRRRASWGSSPSSRGVSATEARYRDRA